jgi:XTP/dITP diphosphohydrolase
LIATTNCGKLAELRGQLADLPVELLSLADLSSYEDVNESGSTFSENAILKASSYAIQAGMPTLADDSGLEVAALGNAPGVLSARYGGAETSFESKIKRLLRELDTTRDRSRTARFVSSVAIADSKGLILHSATGICQGIIAHEPRGNGGFGYDPIFVPDGFDRTFGELSNDIKQKISHRGRAFNRIIPFLRDNIAILT